MVSMKVNGIPEILGTGDAWLVPPGEAEALAAAMSAALDDHWQGDRARVARAHHNVCRHFTATALLPRHTWLAAALPAR